MAFRAGLLLLGWNTQLSYWMKGAIRNLFITGTKKSPVSFSRKIRFDEREIIIEDIVHIRSSEKFDSLRIGDEFSVRYVPQSLYFQSQELGVDGFSLDEESLEALNQNKQATFIGRIEPSSNKIKFETAFS